MTRKSWSISRATAWRMASAFLFLVRLRLIFGRPQLADLGVGLDQLTSESLELAELGHFALGLVYGGGGWQ
jgi:hypothetical protein